MFTGIVQHLGRVASFERNSFGAAIIVDRCGWEHIPSVGDSIAVNGCCLTVAALADSGMRFDVICQTLDRTALGSLAAGAMVNLEHAVTPQTMLGGHMVQGHIDCVGLVSKIERGASEHRLQIAVPQVQLMDHIVEKGSIAVSGVSLTIATIGSDWFDVALIPTTLRLTNLGTLNQGDRVNLETDYIAKVVVNWLRRSRQ